MSVVDHTQPETICIALTLGDPAGIGPEIAAKALTGANLPPHAFIFAVGPARALRKELDALGHDAVPLVVAHKWKELQAVATPERIHILEPPPPPGGDWADVTPGTVCAEGGEAAFQAAMMAARLARDGFIDAICTGPIHKKALQLAGHPFPGHTEILASVSETRRAVMLLQGGGLRVALATIHAPLHIVPRLINVPALVETLWIVNDALRRDWGIAAPRIAVTGLNPHAGDGGVLGSEEETVIGPAIRQACEKGLCATGPWPADTVFHKMLQGAFDVVLAMYHDQGLAVLKTLAFEDGVNITLGLPFIRTSVDHGTAMDIAGRGQANPRSLERALNDAVFLARNRRATRAPSSACGAHAAAGAQKDATA